MRYLSYTLLFLVVPISLITGQIKPGARQVALSNSDVSLCDDVFSLFTNPAGPAQMNWRELGIYYSPAPFGLKELSNIYGAYHEPTGFGSIALGFMSYGFELYKEIHINLGYSLSLHEDFYAGFTLSYQSLRIMNYGSDKIITLNVGGLAYLSGNIRIGFSADNITRASYGTEQDQTPVALSIGASIDLSNRLTLITAIHKDLLYDVSYRFGIEYSPLKYLELRAGTATEPGKFSAGIGVNYAMFEFDYAGFHHLDLGLTHQVSLIVSFEEK